MAWPFKKKLKAIELPMDIPPPPPIGREESMEQMGHPEIQERSSQFMIPPPIMTPQMQPFQQGVSPLETVSRDLQLLLSELKL